MESCQSPWCGFDGWPLGVKTSCCCSDINRKMLILFWSRPLLIKTMLCGLSLHVIKRYSFLNTWKKRDRGSFLSTWISIEATLCWIPCGHYGSSSELGHISITFIFHACAWVCTDPARPLGSLIIRTLRPECRNSSFWLRGCTGLYGRQHGQFQGLSFFLQKDVDVASFTYSGD